MRREPSEFFSRKQARHAAFHAMNWIKSGLRICGDLCFDSGHVSGMCMEPFDDAFEIVGVAVDLADMSFEFFGGDGPDAEVESMGEFPGGHYPGDSESSEESSDCVFIHGKTFLFFGCNWLRLQR